MLRVWLTLVSFKSDGIQEAGEMTQLLRALVVLPEDPGLTPSICIAVQLTPVPGNLKPAYSL